MNKIKPIIVGLLMGATFAGPVLGAEEACLQNNRIWGWQAVDQRTLIVTDRNYRRFTVHLTGGCLNLDKYVGASLVVRAKTNLGCIGQGDRVAFDSPGIGPLTCFVTSVEEAPAKAAPSG